MAAINLRYSVLKASTRQLIEKHALGPSIWGERDCFTFVSDCIRGLTAEDHHMEPIFLPPDWVYDGTEKEAIRMAIKEHGSVRKFWIDMIFGEPYLTPVPMSSPPQPGMICLTQSKPYDGLPRVGVLGSELSLWTRTHEGISTSWPISRMYALPCHS